MLVLLDCIVLLLLARRSWTEFAIGLYCLLCVIFITLLSEKPEHPEAIAR